MLAESAMLFGILGPLEVVLAGRSIPLGGRHGRVCLAVLLLRAGQPVSADELVQALWGDDAPPTARKALHIQISRLRARLGDGAGRLVTTSAGYRLDVAAEELDAARFEALAARAHGESPDAAVATLREALDLWRGPALADLRYEPFAQEAVRRLEELRATVREDWLDARVALGDHAAVAAELDARAADAPLRERLVALRMRALYGAGRHTEALAVFRDARHRLDEELGLEPGPELRALEQAILLHDPSLRAARPALPAPATATIGRGREIEAVVSMLEVARLVTLTGPGGIGKTRIALEVARHAAVRDRERVHLAWLATVSDPVDVPAALAAAVGVAPNPGERPAEAIVRRLAAQPALLVADNLEHVLDATSLLAELLAACPRLRILATSREPLRLRGERCLPVEPLAVADGVVLFAERARDRRPEFRVTDANAPAVSEICRALDGLPLALELAAGRIGLLKPEQIVARLGDALGLLEGGPRDAPARQRTIRATLEWSVDLLDVEERQALLGLAGFVGGAELEAAEQVTGASLRVLDALVARSLVRIHDGRLVMLEVVRQFAAAALAGSPGRDAVRERHADWFLALTERLAPEVERHGQGAALDTFRREHGNLRAALEWLLAAGDGERALRLAAALEPYWSAVSLEREGARLLGEALEIGGAASERTRGRAHVARSLLTWWDAAAQREDARAGLALSRACGDVEGQVLALDALATHETIGADFAAAIAHAREERALAEGLGDDYRLAMAVKRQAFAEPGLAAARAFAGEATVLLRRCGSVHRIVQMLMAVVMVALADEDYEAAEAFAVDGLRAAHEAGDRFGLMGSLGNAGMAALFLERFVTAEERFRAQLAICRDEHMEGRWWEPALGLAAVRGQAGDGERAATLAAAAQAPLEEAMPEVDRPVYERMVSRFVAPACAALDRRSRERAEAAGRALTLDEVCDLAHAPPGAALDRAGAETLVTR